MGECGRAAGISSQQPSGIKHLDQGAKLWCKPLRLLPVFFNPRTRTIIYHAMHLSSFVRNMQSRLRILRHYAFNPAPNILDRVSAQYESHYPRERRKEPNNSSPSVAKEG